MPEILTTQHTILCPHGGKGTSLPTDPTFQISNSIGLLEGDTGTLSCPFVLFPCIGYILRSMGLNASTVRTRKIILITDFNQTITGLPLIVLPAGTGVLDDSVPTPIPAGQTAPPLSPELADNVKPVVNGSPILLSFDSVTKLPVMLTVTFNLFSSFPMQWILTLIKGTPTPGNLDITNGLPAAGLTVVPPGGKWDTQNLTITMTMTALFMAGLGIGEHHFFMTGVNKRGLSGFNDPPVKLKVK